MALAALALAALASIVCPADSFRSGTAADECQEKVQKLEEKIEMMMKVYTPDEEKMFKEWFSAVENEDVQKIRLLISLGADIDLKQKWRDDHSALDLAADQGNVEMVKTLISLKADVNSRAYSGQTPLYQAGGRCFTKTEKSTEITKLLLEAKGDPNLKDTTFGRAPLIYAARDDCVEMVKLLLAAGADANTEDNDGMTPLDHAEQRHRTEVEKILSSAQ